MEPGEWGKQPAAGATGEWYGGLTSGGQRFSTKK
ncbi:Uncharacterised protein [Serratia odorifera]|uniref:Uncharacterized protein n=1 Tax=Serratia odorifera TaxID=618 RepID=A0A3S4DN81_SEROD|nr:Uncharacterised protein [Serratia odorifera]